MMTRLRQMIEAAAIASERRRVAREMLRLNDHLLTDIGVRRDELESLALGGLPHGDDNGTRVEQVPPIMVPQQAFGPTRRPAIQGCG